MKTLGIVETFRIKSVSVGNSDFSVAVGLPDSFLFCLFSHFAETDSFPKVTAVTFPPVD